MYPIKFDKAFWIQNGPLMAMLAGGVYLLLQRENSQQLSASWAQATMGTWARFLPMLILLFATMTLGSIIAKIHGDKINTYLMNNQTMGPILGSCIVPTTATAVGIVENSWKMEALRPGLLYFVQASALMSIPLFFLRSLGFTNTEIMHKMYISGLVISLAMIPVIGPFYRLVNLIYGWCGSLRALL